MKDLDQIIIFDYKGELDLKISDNSRVEVYFISFKKNNSFSVKTYQKKNSCIKIFYSFLNESDTNINFNNYILGDDNRTKIFIRGINNNKTNINLTSEVKEKTYNNVIVQSAKVINEKGVTKIDPNLIAVGDEVLANHFVSIQNYNQEEIHYLKTKGLSEIQSKRAIKTGLVYGIIRSNIKKVIKEVYGE